MHSDSTIFNMHQSGYEVIIYVNVPLQTNITTNMIILNFYTTIYMQERVWVLDILST